VASFLRHHCRSCRRGRRGCLLHVAHLEPSSCVSGGRRLPKIPCALRTDAPGYRARAGSHCRPLAFFDAASPPAGVRLFRTLCPGLDPPLFSAWAAEYNVRGCRPIGPANPNTESCYCNSCRCIFVSMDPTAVGEFLLDPPTDDDPLGCHRPSFACPTLLAWPIFVLLRFSFLLVYDIACSLNSFSCVSTMLRSVLSLPPGLPSSSIFCRFLIARCCHSSQLSSPGCS